MTCKRCVMDSPDPGITFNREGCVQRKHWHHINGEKVLGRRPWKNISADTGDVGNTTQFWASAGGARFV